MRANPNQRWTYWLAILAVLGAAASGLAGELADKIKAVTEQPRFKHAHWGLLVADRRSGDVLYEENADKLFVPASTTKLFSCATALDALGADYRFETPIYARGTMDAQGVLDGDLILVASGDLSLGGRTTSDGRIAFRNNDHTYADFAGKAELTDEDPLAGIKELARQVAESGIKRVRGDVLIDTRLFESAKGTGSGPGRLTPIMVNDNLIDFVVTPRADKSARVEWRPRSVLYSVDAEVETIKADGETRVTLHRAPHGYVLRGQIAANHKPLVLVDEVDDAAQFARALLIESLDRAGVRAAASGLRAPPQRLPLPEPQTYQSLKRVALFKSPPFSESLKLILKVSHNLHASTLPLLVAAKHGERTLSEGLRRQHAFLKQANVGVESISFGGGAGGDRADYVTPRATVALLRYMAERKDFSVYRDALPVLGIDGTLAEVVAGDSSARDKIQAKTGTLVWANVMNGTALLNSKALAGYATTASGRELAFAMFVNQVQLPNAKDREQISQTLGKLCEILHSQL